MEIKTASLDFCKIRPPTKPKTHAVFITISENDAIKDQILGINNTWLIKWNCCIVSG